MSPLADAVRFVNHHDFRRTAIQEVLEQIGLKPLRRHIKQFYESRIGIAKNPVLFRSRNRGVDIGGGDSFFAQGINLIFHERDQRGNDDAVTLPDEDRKLIAERFPRAGRHDDAQIPAGENGFYDRLLIVKKCIKAKMAFQCVVKLRIHVINLNLPD